MLSKVPPWRESVLTRIYSCRLLKRGETSGREDDNIEAVRKRFKTFQEESMPIVSLYREQGLLREISSVASVDEVWAQTKALFEAM